MSQMGTAVLLPPGYGKRTPGAAPALWTVRVGACGSTAEGAACSVRDSHAGSAEVALLHLPPRCCGLRGLTPGLLPAVSMSGNPVPRTTLQFLGK